MLFRIAGAVLAPLGRIAHQVLEGHPAVEGFGGQAQDFPHAFVPQLQAQMLVEDADALGHVLQHRPQLGGLAPVLFFRQLAFGDVLGGAAGPQGLAPGIPEESAPVDEVSQATVLQQHPVLDGEGFLLGRVVVGGLLHLVPVLRVHQLQEVGVGQGLARVQAHQAVGFLGTPEAAAAQVPLPAADVADALGFQQTVLGALQFLRRQLFPFVALGEELALLAQQVQGEGATPGQQQQGDAVGEEIALAHRGEDFLRIHLGHQDPGGVRHLLAGGQGQLAAVVDTLLLGRGRGRGAEHAFLPPQVQLEGRVLAVAQFVEHQEVAFVLAQQKGLGGGAGHRTGLDEGKEDGAGVDPLHQEGQTLAAAGAADDGGQVDEGMALGVQLQVA